MKAICVLLLALACSVAVRANKRVALIGAGFAGASAAMYLRDKHGDLEIEV